MGVRGCWRLSISSSRLTIVGKPLLGEKYVHGRKKNNASGHYVRQRTNNIRAHALRTDQLSICEQVFIQSSLLPDDATLCLPGLVVIGSEEYDLDVLFLYYIINKY